MFIIQSIILIKQLNQPNCSTELVKPTQPIHTIFLDCSNRVLGLCLVSKDYKNCGPNSLTRIIQSISINQLLLRFADLSSRFLGGCGLDVGECNSIKFSIKTIYHFSFLLMAGNQDVLGHLFIINYFNQELT